LLLAELPLKQASALTAQWADLPRKRVYAHALTLRDAGTGADADADAGPDPEAEVDPTKG
jgi:hypothetical protein